MAATVTASPAAPSEEYEGCSGALRWIVLAAVMLGTLMQVIDTSIVNVAIPVMMGTLGATLEQIGWVSTSYIIANVILLPLTGWLSARFGRRRYFAASVVLFTMASFFCGTAHNLSTLILWRIVQGAGGAALLSTAQATMMEIFPPRQLGMVQAIYGIGVMVGPTVGPTLGGWITDNYSWPWIFFINVPIGALATALTIVFMRDSPHQQRPRGGVDFVGIGLLAIGLGCLQTLLEEGNRNDWFESAFIQWMGLLAVTGLIAFVIWELRASHPAVNLRVLRNRGLAAGSVFGAVIGFGLFGGIFILPVFLQQLLHYSAEQTGWILFPGAMATAAMMPVVGKLVNVFDARKLTGAGALLFIASMLMLRTLTLDTGPEEIYWPLIVRGAAMGFIWVPLTLASLAGLRGREIAEGTGLFNLTRQLGGSAGIAFLSTFLDHRTAFHSAVISEHISLYSPATIERLQMLQSAMMAKGAALEVARQQALALLSGIVRAQAAVMAFEDAFIVIAWVFIAALPLLLLFRKGSAVEGARPTAHMSE